MQAGMSAGNAYRGNLLLMHPWCSSLHSALPLSHAVGRIDLLKHCIFFLRIDGVSFWCF